MSIEIPSVIAEVEIFKVGDRLHLSLIDERLTHIK